MWPIIAELLLAPLSTGLGAYLVRSITDETHSDSYVTWFFGYAIGLATLAAIFSENLLSALIAIILIVVGLNYVAPLGIAAGHGLLLISITAPAQYLLIFSILASCAFLGYHKKSLWSLAVLPTLISAVALLL